MSRDLLNTILLAASFLALFGMAEVLYHFLKVKAEFTRKLVHFGTGLLTLLFPVMLGNHWLVLLLCSGFAFLLLISLKYELLKSINAIDRVSIGSLAYPVSVYGCYLVYDIQNQDYLYFYLPILTLAVCDPVAALTGKRWPVGKYRIGSDHKTLMGSFMFLVSAVAVVMISGLVLKSDLSGQPLLVRGVLIGLAASVTEALSGKGSDNLTIPASVLAALALSESI